MTDLPWSRSVFATSVIALLMLGSSFPSVTFSWMVCARRLVRLEHAVMEEC